MQFRLSLWSHREAAEKLGGYLTSLAAELERQMGRVGGVRGVEEGETGARGRDEGRSAPTPPRRRLVVGVVGPPGSGKSTLAKALGEAVPTSVVLPMDGFHHPLSRLAEFPDPAEALRCRGAPWTFDSAGLAAAVERAARGDDVDAPGFDHAVGDPVPGAVRIRPEHRVVIVEGNYLLLAYEPWARVGRQLDAEVFVLPPPPVALARRLARRHVLAGASIPDAVSRALGSDANNGRIVAATKRRARILVAVHQPWKLLPPLRETDGVSAAW